MPRYPQVLLESWKERARNDPSLHWAINLARKTERRLIQAQNESESLRHRVNRARKDGEAGGKRLGALAILDGIDALDMAMSHEDSGLGMVRDGLLKALISMGAEEVEGVGSSLNPSVHEVVQGAGERVKRVLRRGFLLDGILIRAAMVEAGG